MATWLSESTPGGGHQRTYNTICPPYILGCWAHNRDCLVSPTHWPASHHAWTCDTSLTHLEKQGRGRHRQAAKNMTLISFKSFPLWTDTPNIATECCDSLPVRTPCHVVGNHSVDACCAETEETFVIWRKLIIQKSDSLVLLPNSRMNQMCLRCDIKHQRVNTHTLHLFNHCFFVS